MDVPHPCVYLWTVGAIRTDAMAKKMTWMQCFMSMDAFMFRALRTSFHGGIQSLVVVACEGEGTKKYCLLAMIKYSIVKKRIDT